MLTHKAEHLERLGMVNKDTYEEHTIHVVHITMLPSTVMNVVLWHGNLWAIEDGRLGTGVRIGDVQHGPQGGSVPRSYHSR